jgi:hypothetical protein
MRDPHNHQSRGFGFITFQRDDSAKQVLQNRYHDMMGKRVGFSGFTSDVSLLSATELIFSG